jgi:leucyl aminopeptidase (aminopeptidase T)
MPDLTAAVDTVIDRCLAVRAGENVVVVVDPGTRAIGEALRERASAGGADAVLCVMDEREADGNEPPAAVAGALAAADVFVAPTRKSLSHTRARKAATDHGARGATLPGVTEDMLARLMACDFEAVGRRSQALAALLTEADEAHVTCPLGTDLGSTSPGARGSPTTGSSPGSARSATCPAARGSSRRPGGRAGCSSARWRESGWWPTGPRS